MRGARLGLPAAATGGNDAAGALCVWGGALGKEKNEQKQRENRTGANRQPSRCEQANEQERIKNNMGKFHFIQTAIPGVVIVEPTVYGDSRGYFMETYQAEEFAACGIAGPFVQDNQSKSTRGVMSGLHFQKQHTQGKLVRVILGEVFDVAVDCRPHSPTFGKWVGETLSAENKKQLYVPQGFAHGFLVLSEEAEFTYKCTDYYDPASEGGIRWDDADIGIVWPKVEGGVRLSPKDAVHPGFRAQRFGFFERW